MSDSAEIGALPASSEGQDHERGRFGDLGDRLSRVFPRTARSEHDAAVAVLEETVEFVPPDVEQPQDWAPRFATAWRGYDRSAVDVYLAELELELEALRAERVPEARAREEIARVGDETSAILSVAHEKARTMMSRAQAQADALVAQAQAEAKAVTADAERRLGELDGDTDAVWQDRTRLIDDTRRLADRLLSVADDAAERFPPEAEETAAPTSSPPSQPAPQPPGPLAGEHATAAPPWRQQS